MLKLVTVIALTIALESAAVTVASAISPDQRDEFQRLASRTIVQEVNDHPDTFGGIYYDNNANEFVVLYATDTQPSVENAANLPIRFEHVDDSQAELTTAQDAIVAAILEDPATYGPQDVSLDTINNEVEVIVSNTQAVGDTIASLGLTGKAKIKKGSAHSRGDYTDPTDGSTVCSSRSNCDPLRAGIGIQGLDEISSGVCTLGYYAYNPSNYNLNMVTAGHCGSEGKTWYAGVTDEVIGISILNAKNTTDSLDAQKTSTIGDFNISPHNLLFKQSDTKDMPIESVEGRNQTWIGETIRISGLSTGKTNGTITDTRDAHWWSDSGTIRLSWVWEYSGETGPGDSGAPVYVTDGAGHASIIGIVQGETQGTSRRYFTHQADIRDVLNATPCVTANCHQ